VASGLGIGTTPSAFVAHGIDTTIVEIDPVVYNFAQKYFNLPRNLTAEIRDAVQYVEEAKQMGSRFDYVIHDVFTGGAEPAELFTPAFIQGLHDLLEDDGVAAIVS
jgi:spermidine synthase